VTFCSFINALSLKILKTDCDRMFASSHRIKIAGEKVDALKNHKKAICLYANAKYPAADFQDYQTCLTIFPNRFVRKPHSPSHKTRVLVNTTDRGLDQVQI